MTLWGSVSRAVRTPSRSGDDFATVDVTENPLAGDSRLIALKNKGTRNLEAEDLTAYEIGIRAQPHDWIHLDLSAYYNDYDDLIIYNIDAGDFPTPAINLTSGASGLGVPVSVINRTYTNNGSGVAWGFEFYTRIQVLQDHEFVKKWWIDASYSYIDVDVNRDRGTSLNQLVDGDGDTIGADDAQDIGRTEAHHTIGIRSHMNLERNLELDFAYYYVSTVEEVGSPKVKSYNRFDARVGWRPSEQVETSITVENLFDAGHDEWNAQLFIAGTRVPRTVYGKLTLDF